MCFLLWPIGQQVAAMAAGEMDRLPVTGDPEGVFLRPPGIVPNRMAVLGLRPDTTADKPRVGVLAR